MSEPTLPRHWRLLYDNKYLGAWNLIDPRNPGRYLEAKVTIEEVRIEEVVGEGGRKEDCTILRFAGKRTPMILTKRQGKNLEKLHGSDPNAWKGKQITLWAEERKVKGEMCRVLAIRTRSVRADEMKRQLAPIETFEDLAPSPNDAATRQPGED